MIEKEYLSKDEGFDEEDDDELTIGGPNGDYTIKEYREEYLKLKEKAPNYKWDYSN